MKVGVDEFKVNSNNNFLNVLQGTLSDGLECSNPLERKNSGKLNNVEKSRSLLGRSGSLSSPTKRSTIAKLTSSSVAESKRAP